MPQSFAFFANVWALLASVYSRVRIISLGTNGQSSDQWSLLVISTHSGGDGTHTSQNARCVGHPAPNKAWVTAVRNWGWSGLSSWSDESILRNLSTPAGFRAAFPEYATWNDDKIKEIAAESPEIPYRGVPPG